MTSESNPPNKQMPSNYLFVDLETGGLYPTKHPILQVAAVITDLNFNIQGHFMSYVKPHPDLEVTEQALTINKLTLEALENAPSEKAVANALQNFAHMFGEKGRFAGYNCQFDLEFLSYMWQRHSIDVMPYHVPWLDIYTAAKSRLNNMGLPNFKLASVATHFGLNTDGAHDAMQDLLMTIQIAKYLKDMSKNESESKSLDIETAKFTIADHALLDKISLSNMPANEKMDSAISQLAPASKVKNLVSAGAELEAKIEQLKIAKLAIKSELDSQANEPTE